MRLDHFGCNSLLGGSVQRNSKLIARSIALCLHCDSRDKQEEKGRMTKLALLAAISGAFALVFVAGNGTTAPLDAGGDIHTRSGWRNEFDRASTRLPPVVSVRPGWAVGWSGSLALACWAFLHAGPLLTR